MSSQSPRSSLFPYTTLFRSMLPITFYMDPVIGICMLLAVYKAGIYGGSISAILIKTPGAAASFLTAQDGHALTLKGKAGKALDTSLFASVTGEALATLVLILEIGRANV